MLKQHFYLFFIVIVFASCKDPGKQPDFKKNSSSTPKIDTSITNGYSYREEQDYLKRKRILCDRLAMYDIEKGTDSMELRMWFIPSMWDPIILYILKGKGSRWTLFHYQIYMHTATSEDHYYDDPVTDYFNNHLQTV
jgi:hypothetical protein